LDVIRDSSSKSETTRAAIMRTLAGFEHLPARCGATPDGEHSHA
jgi:hypothetical protein